MSYTRLPSSVCRFDHFKTGWFARWATKLGLDDVTKPVAERNIHRKIWEYCAISQALYERGALKPGRKGLGFAVGREPLVSLFASYGPEILATDIGTDVVAEYWKEGDQYAGAKEGLYFPGLISASDFEERVSYRHADMRDLSGFELGTYDFIWSACSFEHLGSLEAGLTFVKRSANLLKRGGVAVHTTEYNVSSDDETLTSGDQVIYRRQDMKRIAVDLRKQGYRLEPFDFDAGSHRYDFEYDRPPWYQDGRKHLKLQLGPFVATSAMLIIQA